MSWQSAPVWRSMLADSGTHLAELALWNKDAGIEIQKDKGVWYKSISQGMGARRRPERLRRLCCAANVRFGS